MKNKRIIFDARHISNEFSGLGRYSLHLLEGLVIHRSEITSLIVLVESTTQPQNSLYKRLEILVGSCDCASIEETQIKVFSFKHYFSMGKFLRKFHGYEYFYPHFDLPLGIKHPSQCVIHDLFPLVVKGYIVDKPFIKKILFYFLCMHSLLAYGNRCVAISMSTYNDIHRFFPYVKNEKLRVVHSSDCLTGTIDEIGNTESLKSFLFYIGDRRPHKNLKKMIDIYQLLKNKFGYQGNFILAGSAKNFDIDIDNYIKDIEGVHFVGAVTDAELVNYYKKMEALFFLSKYEGFGLPILEAARFDRKIITSNVSSLPEVTPETGLMLAPDEDNEVLASVIDKYLRSTKSINNEAFLSQFSWIKTASKIFLDNRNI